MQKLNWLYPNFLKRIDHYLKINYPHVWRTRVHDFGWFSLVLGNAVAASLGVLVVGWNNVLSEDSVTILYGSFAVMLGFVGLFWAIRLLRFKMKFSGFKMMLTTWLIYVLCTGSLCLNLATFTSSIAYRTACLYSDDVVQTDYNYLTMVKKISYDGENYYSEECQRIEYDKEDYLKMYYTESLKSIVSRHNHKYNEKDNICRDDITSAEKEIHLLQEAKNFVHQPILGKDFNNHKKKSFYHELLQASWLVLMLALLFLPTSLFLLSTFGVRNLLISVFSTLIIFVVTFTLMKTMRIMSYAKIEMLITSHIFITFILGMTLVMGRHRLKVWNYAAGIFLLMLGVVFFTFFMDAVHIHGIADANSLLIISWILPFSLLTSLIATWLIAERNQQPTF